MANIDRSRYRYFRRLTLRWKDNDIYGHVNNVNYYSFFDTAANQYLINEGGLDIHNATEVAFVVASNCQYHQPLAFPCTIETALRVNRLGNSSVEYGIAIFIEDQPDCAAHGNFTHVFVDRESNKPVPISDKIRSALKTILVSAHNEQD